MGTQETCVARMKGSWTCRVCGATVPPRVTHPTAKGCEPPRRFERHTVRWSKDPPLHAWPPAYVHHRGRDLPFLTSPVVGVAASSLISLARIQADDMRAPTEAFRRLLASSPEQVYVDLLYPRMIGVECGSSFHALRLARGVLTAEDHPDVDVESELVAAALGGRQPPRCLQLVGAWDARDVQTCRRAGLWHALVLDAARRWMDIRENPERWDAWIGRALGPEEVEQAGASGMTAQELVLWSHTGDTVPKVVRWWRSGWTAREAQALALAGISPEESTRWLRQGFDVARVREGRKFGLDAEVAAAWYEAGWPLLVAAEAVDRGHSLEAAEELLTVVRKRSAVPVLLSAGLTPELAERWDALGHGTRELLIMAEDGMDFCDSGLVEHLSRDPLPGL